MTWTAGQSSVSSDTEGPAGRCAAQVTAVGRSLRAGGKWGRSGGSGQDCPSLSLSAKLCPRKTHMRALDLSPCECHLIWKRGLRRGDQAEMGLRE